VLKHWTDEETYNKKACPMFKKMYDFIIPQRKFVFYLLNREDAEKQGIVPIGSELPRSRLKNYFYHQTCKMCLKKLLVP